MPTYLGRREALGQLAGWTIFSLFIPFHATRRAMAEEAGKRKHQEGFMKLPQPVADGKISLESTLKNRRTIRSFSSAPLTLDQFSQLLWAAQGISEDGGYKRTAPSAGALYPMDLYAVVGTGGIRDIHGGIYHYGPDAHSASLILKGDHRRKLGKASLSQMWVSAAPLVFVVTAEYDRITTKYGRRGVRYATIEAGHIGQNIFLQAGALGLAAGIVGAFDDEDVMKVMGTDPNHRPLLIMPVGFRG